MLHSYSTFREEHFKTKISFIRWAYQILEDFPYIYMLSSGDRFPHLKLKYLQLWAEYSIRTPENPYRLNINDLWDTIGHLKSEMPSPGANFCWLSSEKFHLWCFSLHISTVFASNVYYKKDPTQPGFFGTCYKKWHTYI